MLREVPIGELVHRCREETMRFLHGEQRDDTYCFEIFERAIVHRDDQAWAAIMVQYRGIVLAYVGQHAAASQVHEPDEYWVSRAFQRFWSAVGPDRFGHFADLAALLKYLKLCVHSVLMDELRARRAGMTSLDELPESTADRASPEGRVIGFLAGEQLWQSILRELHDEAERQVVFLSFASDLKPAAIFERQPLLYTSVSDVYRIKRNVLERLRRSPEIREFLGGDPPHAKRPRDNVY
jgi:hypothetical protein